MRPCSVQQGTCISASKTSEIGLLNLSILKASVLGTREEMPSQAPGELGSNSDAALPAKEPRSADILPLTAPGSSKSTNDSTPTWTAVAERIAAKSAGKQDSAMSDGNSEHDAYLRLN